MRVVPKGRPAPDGAANPGFLTPHTRPPARGSLEPAKPRAHSAAYGVRNPGFVAGGNWHRPGEVGILIPMTDQYYPKDSQATTILVLGILSLVLCQVLGPFAWVMGNKELAGIDAGRRAPQNRGTAQAGRILGIISTVLMIIGVAILLFFLVVLTVTSVS